jgi:hypothetical protein
MAVSFTDILSYSTETGMAIPQTSDIKQNIQNAMFEIFGSGFDTTEETTNGRLIEALTLLTKNAIGVTAQNLNYLNLNAVSGKQLDDYATFFGITRLPATKSRILIRVTSTTQNYNLKSGTKLKDLNGNIYTIVKYRGDYIPEGGSYTDLTPNSIVDGIYCTIAGGNEWEGYGYIEADEYGPIFPEIPIANANNASTPENQLTLITADSKIKNIVSATGTRLDGALVPNGMSVLGRYEESDFELRNRIKESRDFGASSTMAIANAIWKTYPELRTVRVISNDEAKEKTINGVKLYPHSILVCVSGNLSLTDTILTDSTRKEIALSIYKTKAAGVSYTDPRMNKDLNSPVWNADAVGNVGSGLTVNTSENPNIYSFRKNIIDVTDISTGIDHKVVFYEALSITFYITCSVKINGYTGMSVEDDIKKVINQYVGGKISTLTPSELSLIVTANIPGIFITDMRFYKISGTEPYQPVDLTSITPSVLEILIPKSIEVKVV